MLRWAKSGKSAGFVFFFRLFFFYHVDFYARHSAVVSFSASDVEAATQHNHDDADVRLESARTSRTATAKTDHDR